MWEGLPARTFLRQPYREVAPVTGLRGESDEAIAGWYRAQRLRYRTARRSSPRVMARAALSFCASGSSKTLHTIRWPSARSSNLVQHVSRRAIAPRQPLPLEQRVVEWMRQQRRERLRRWMVVVSSAFR